MEKKILHEINKIPHLKVKVNYPMNDMLSMRVGGHAKYFVMAHNIESLQQLLRTLVEFNMDYFLIGNGTNVVIRDGGYQGFIIKLGEEFSKIHREGTKLIVGSSALLSSVSKFAQKNGLGGMEFASGIPGSIGGAVTMNAGAYGGEIGDVIDNVTVLDGNGTISVLSKEEMKFEYRGSIVFKEKYIVLGATFNLFNKDKDEILLEMTQNTQKRNSKQPVEYPSAGSTFKRPEGNFAGKLIDDSGLRGLFHGGAQVAQKHCGFIINNKNATATEFEYLLKFVQKIVKDKFGIELDPEIKVIGDRHEINS